MRRRTILLTQAKRARRCAAGIAGLLIFAALATANADAIEKLPDDKLYSFIGNDPLPAGTVPWQLLRQVKLVEEQQDGKPVSRPEFAAQLRQLDRKDVKLYGFVLPLSTAAKQTHFLISPLPTHCPYCISQGPDSLVEVVARIPVAYNAYDAIVVSGRFELVNDASLYYRLTNAESIRN